MDIICPACGKKNDSASECIRCGCEFSILEKIVHAAERELFISRENLGNEDFRDALQHARHSWHLKKSPEAARLAFLAALAVKDFEQAGRWYVRTEEKGDSFSI